jgi:hypothetical protein
MESDDVLKEDEWASSLPYPGYTSIGLPLAYGFDRPNNTRPGMQISTASWRR